MSATMKLFIWLLPRRGNLSVEYKAILPIYAPDGAALSHLPFHINGLPYPGQLMKFVIKHCYR